MNSLIDLSTDFQTLSTRDIGKLAREQLLLKLSDDNTVTLDFNGKAISPSFADEFIGILARDMGFDAFKNKVKMTNVSESSKQIIKHVINKRIYQSITMS
ncbi:STAS-like domain-containing protein [Tolumonas lignilytica]|uniref:STAS-like domain-containing protein n=1 Tax=Tolumonas lignilytica TaxID=1283284 RepID=UPI0004634D90|nr:STAS-like domain-containing protein [Tolumonas lignilytica]